VLVAAVTRLVTFVDVRNDTLDARQISVSARHEALLADGRRVLLLGDRGWSASLHGDGSPDVWSQALREEIESTARMVVGPDEPLEERSHQDMEAGHWAYLEAVLRQQGVVADAGELRQLPHDVMLSERLLARIGGHRGDAVSP
jgi:hypothetical protein